MESRSANRHICSLMRFSISPRASRTSRTTAARPLIGRERSDHEARVLALVEELRLGHDTPRLRPALVSSVRELSEDARRLAAALVQYARLLHLGADDPREALIARQAKA